MNLLCAKKLEIVLDYKRSEILSPISVLSQIDYLHSFLQISRSCEIYETDMDYESKQRRRKIVDAEQR